MYIKNKKPNGLGKIDPKKSTITHNLVTLLRQNSQHRCNILKIVFIYLVS